MAKKIIIKKGNRSAKKGSKKKSGIPLKKPKSKLPVAKPAGNTTGSISDSGLLKPKAPKTFAIDPSEKELAEAATIVPEITEVPKAKSIAPETKPKPAPPPADDVFRFYCMRCGQKLKVRRSSVGTMKPCPSCKYKIEVPEPFDD